MEPAHHTDPLEEALSHGSQRVAQVASLAAAMTQVVMQHRALDDARRAMMSGQEGAQVLDNQERLLHQQARLGWAPAHDPQWLAHADLLETARKWAAAAAYANTDPTAASALRKCEDRLRKLHPYAMACYDRLCDDRVSPLDAMQQTAPLFTRAPTARTGDPSPERRVLRAGNSEEFTASADEMASRAGDPEPSPDTESATEARGRQIVARLQSRARATGHPELGPDELAMILDAATNLPQPVIERLTQQPASPANTRNGENRSAAQLAAQSFPFPATAAVQTGSTGAAKHARRTATRVHEPHHTKRPGRSS